MCVCCVCALVCERGDESLSRLCDLLSGCVFLLSPQNECFVDAHFGRFLRMRWPFSVLAPRSREMRSTESRLRKSQLQAHGTKRPDMWYNPELAAMGPCYWTHWVGFMLSNWIGKKKAGLNFPV